MIIFAIQCKKNKKMFVGSTSRNLTGAITSIFSALRDKKGYCDEMQADFHQYTKKGFEIFILEEDVSKDDAKQRVNHYIRKYKSIEKGYNKKEQFKIPIFYGEPKGE